jgi:Leucine-rich repeat (LRR) protein
MTSDNFCCMSSLKVSQNVKNVIFDTCQTFMAFNAYLEGIPPCPPGSLEKLKYLSLGLNSLSTIDGVWNFTAIHHLDLSYNW